MGHSCLQFFLCFLAPASAILPTSPSYDHLPNSRRLWTKHPWQWRISPSQQRCGGCSPTEGGPVQGISGDINRTESENIVRGLEVPNSSRFIQIPRHIGYSHPHKTIAPSTNPLGFSKSQVPTIHSVYHHSPLWWSNNEPSSVSPETGFVNPPKLQVDYWYLLVLASLPHDIQSSSILSVSPPRPCAGRPASCWEDSKRPQTWNRWRSSGPPWPSWTPASDEDSEARTYCGQACTTSW